MLVKTVSKVPFNIHVHKILKSLKIKDARPIQAYVWPAIMRHMNVCLINGRKTGKTMSYLPALCSYVLEKNERYKNLPNELGPIAVILCTGCSEAEEVYETMNYLCRATKITLLLAIPPVDKNCLVDIATLSSNLYF